MFGISKDMSYVSQPREGSIVTRGSKKVKLISDLTNITRVQNSPLYRGITIWDKLPEDIRLDSKFRFRCAIKNLKL